VLHFLHLPLGFYDLVAQDGISSPEMVFDVHMFREDPSLFYKYGAAILPSQFEPSLTHHFISALDARGKLLRNYTQNIDNLERKVDSYSLSLPFLFCCQHCRLESSTLSSVMGQWEQ
jgi:NAD-dependent SIR2 family protein deacetylase